MNSKSSTTRASKGSPQDMSPWYASIRGSSRPRFLMQLGKSSKMLKLLQKLSTPEKIQKYLDDLPYNKEKQGETCRSPRLVIELNTAHCFEAALFGAAALRVNGRPPLILDLEAVRDDDHVIAVYRSHGCWGAIAKSNYAGLRFRSPVYRTLRELALSYFEHYYNLKGEKTLRAYSRPVSLARFDSIEWMTTEEPLWPIAEYLCAIKHTPILNGTMGRMYMDERLYK